MARKNLTRYPCSEHHETSPLKPQTERVDFQLSWSRSWIEVYARRSRDFNFHVTVYHFKHLVENEMNAFERGKGRRHFHVYVSESSFIEAARSLGYRVARRGRHSYLNMTSKYKPLPLPDCYARKSSKSSDVQDAMQEALLARK